MTSSMAAMTVLVFEQLTQCFFFFIEVFFIIRLTSGFTRGAKNILGSLGAGESS